MGEYDQIYGKVTGNMKLINRYNEYISKTEREFKVIISNQIVCKIRYIPFIDPGFLWYDADVEEFDFLLQFYNLVKDKTSIYNIIKYIQKKQT